MSRVTKEKLTALITWMPQLLQIKLTNAMENLPVKSISKELTFGTPNMLMLQLMSRMHALVLPVNSISKFLAKLKIA
jgi:hypothetical protein